jgi:hypothetical protein
MQVAPFKHQGYYTEIHNALLDVVMPQIKPTSWTILCFIVRQTKGWQREVCRLSLATIADLSGIKSRTTVIEGLKELRSFTQDDRPAPLIIEYEGDDQWSPKSYGLNRAVRIEWEPFDAAPCGSKNGHHCCSKNGHHCCSKNGQPIRKEENHVEEKRGNKPPLPSSPVDDFSEPLPDEILKAELSKVCGVAPVNGSALKLERAAVAIASIGGSVELLREYVTSESKRSFKIAFIAEDFGAWLAARQRDRNSAQSPAPQYCPECGGAKTVMKIIGGKRSYGIKCETCDGTGRLN